MRLEPATLSDQAGHKRLLVFAPHPDDEVFGCGGLLAKQEAAEAFMIVLLTDGAKGGVFNAHDDPVRVRQAESQRALKALGIWERCELRAWAYPDQALMPGQDLVKAMLQCMQDFKPDVVLAPSPFESHADHRVASLCTYWAWQQCQGRPTPAHAQVSTPGFALEAEPRLMFYEVGQPLRANVLVDISASMERKRSAMACFASQLAQQAYGETIEALNRYRSYSVHHKARFVEAYLCLEPGQKPDPDVSSAFSQLSQTLGVDAMKTELTAPRIKPVCQTLPEASQNVERLLPHAKVAVIMRTQWRASLRKSIESVLNQSHRPICLIVVSAQAAFSHDAGTDTSEHLPDQAKQCLDWIDGYVSQDLELLMVGAGFGTKACNTPTQQQGSTIANSLTRAQAINCGLEAALSSSANWFAFLDDDDQWQAHHIEGLLQCLQSNENRPNTVLGAYAGTRMLDSQGRWLNTLHQPWDRDRIFRANFLPIHAVLFHRKIVEQGLRADEQFDLYEDWDFWIGLSRQGDLIYSPQVSADYYQSDTSLAHGRAHAEIRLAARQAIYRKWIDHLSIADLEAIFRCDELDVQTAQAQAHEVRELLHERSLDLQHQQTLLAKAQSQNEWLEAARVQLEENNRALEAQVLQGQAEVSQLQSEVSQLQLRERSLEFDARQLHREVAAREQSIQALKNSLSWKASAPLRLIGEGLRLVFKASYPTLRLLLKPLARALGVPHPMLWLRQRLGKHPHQAQAGSSREGLPLSKPTSLASSSSKSLGALVSKEDLKAQARAELQAWLLGDERLDFRSHRDPSSSDRQCAVSVIVVLFNQAGLTKRCLDSILAYAQGTDIHIDLEVLLVDNASSDDTQALLGRLDGVRIIRHEENLGFLKAVNKAAPLAAHELLLFLNNDAELLPGSLEAAVKRLASDARIQAVGGPVILYDGSLQEAGNIIWNDASCLGYGRGMSPNDDAFQHLRYVDYVSGAFLLTHKSRFLAMGCFNEQLAPAYYEESDYCARLWQAGLRVVYEPLAAIRHLEFASSTTSDWAIAQQQKNQQKFQVLHKQWLSQQWSANCEQFAESLPKTSAQALDIVRLCARARPPGVELSWLPDRLRLIFEDPQRCPRVLVLDDRVPHPQLGSGFPRSNDMLCTLAALGCHVCFYPVTVPVDDWAAIRASLPATVEVVLHRGIQGLESFLLERSGWFSHLLVSRPHNMAIFRPIWERYAKQFESVRMIYDAEAIFTYRDASLARLRGEQASESNLQSQLRQELELAIGVDCITTVSDHEAQSFKSVLQESLHPTRPSQSGTARKPQTMPQIHVLGHRLEAKATPRGFEQRHGLLFVGALHEDNTPNAESLVWFIDEVWPHLQNQWSALSGTDIAFDIVGPCHAPSIWARRRPGIRLHGAVADLSPFFDQARVFIVPTRYAAGIPHKAHEAAARGVPMVVSRLIAQQLGWDESLVSIADDSKDFASACIKLLSDHSEWTAKRSACLDRVAIDCSSRQFEEAMLAALGFSLNF